MKIEDYDQVLRAAVYAAFLAQMVAGVRKGSELSVQEMQGADACAHQLLATWERAQR